ncbi:glutamate synthase subunit beta [Acuticoccus mangrovi]|uniref:Glutamate synthase subunit beta n=1 Tax=Acuticoccus mangrovi TaxID=2796142 RepID=A0A934INU8_9HYPH|nr:glutamate synthase subunit beta [Acuticoccus mangrovi]MBJ3775808.1 glutamate synthase subunit beta [Acuticoccus mangrovi]
MGKVTGFLEIDRQELKYQPAADRIRHFKEFTLPLSDPEVERQAARCMDCGIPFCQSDVGCPVDNQIPDWNDLVYHQDWQEAARNLHSTNNFPEFTGRVCPAPCEEACTLNIENTPVAIKAVEQAIADKAWENGWIVPQPPLRLTGKKVAVIGAGSAGLAAAQQLARVGHDVHVFERYARPGGLLRYGIPDFKMEKANIDRRCDQLAGEGVVFHYNEDIGAERMRELVASFDAVLLTTGAERPRDPGLPGVELEGVHYAMPFLVQQNRRVGRENIAEPEIDAAGKHVVVVGGGDTASDCIGTSIRQGALAVTQLDIRPMPPIRENKDIVWPYWPTKFRTSSSQAEGADREFAAATLEIVGNKKGRVSHVRCARVDEKRRPIEGTEFDIRADLVLIAIGFSGPMLDTYAKAYDFELDARTNIAANTTDYRTNIPKVYAAGDVRRGQSLVVWAIREGRQAARAIDLDLMGSTTLPR